MAKKYKYSYYVFDTKEDYDLFLELIEFHGCTGKYSGYDRNEIYYFVCSKFDPNEINKRKLLGTEIKYIRLDLKRDLMFPFITSQNMIMLKWKQSMKGWNKD